MLVTDRQLTSTAILYRLFIRYQPAEAETLVLTTSSTTTSTESTPLKLKVIETGDNMAGKKSAVEVGATGKGRGGAIDAPCRWFKTDTGCRALERWSTHGSQAAVPTEVAL